MNKNYEQNMAFLYQKTNKIKEFKILSYVKGLLNNILKMREPKIAEKKRHYLLRSF